MIRAVIDQHCPGSRYDSLDQETAIAALAAGRACIIHTGGSHNQASGNAANAVNEGESLVGWIVLNRARYGEDSVRANLSWYLVNVLSCLHPINHAGAVEIVNARVFCVGLRAAAE